MALRYELGDLSLARNMCIVFNFLFFYFFSVAAENAAFMNPAIMDPRYAGMWGIPGAWDETQWQQFYQMIQPFQQQQHKQQQQQQQQQQHQQQQQLQQIHERSKQFMLGKQGGQFPFSAYPFYYSDKHFDQQQKVINKLHCYIDELLFFF